ncbi:MAG: porin family protein [Bacteroidota bacterium]
MIKNAVLSFILIFCLLSISAQSRIGWGLKGGLNYGSSGNVINAIGETVENPDNNLGWHLGVYGKLGNRFYIRPELVYTNLNSDYNNSKFKLQKLDLPVLAGFKIIGPLHVFIGPSFQYVLNTDLENLSLSDVENEFSVGFNVGAGINFGRLGIDIRYERGFSENEANIIGEISNTIVGRLETRPEQLIVSVSYNFIRKIR